jgi:transposase
MWTRENRGRYERKGVRYPSDLTDQEWALIAPLIPPAKRGGRKREVDVREVMNGVLYVLETGCQWRALPKDLPPKSTVHDYFTLWEWDGTLARTHHGLYLKCRDLEGREASPSAGVIDSQSVKGAEKGGPPDQGLSFHTQNPSIRRPIPPDPSHQSRGSGFVQSPASQKFTPLV